jgi:hypothetical protein
MVKQPKLLDIVTGVFVAVLLMSNILSSAKLIDLRTSLFGIPLAFDAGTLVFPLSYIFGDILTEIYGFRRARRVIWIGFASLALSSLFVWLAGQLPGDAVWEGGGGSDAYAYILGGVSGLIVASLIAYFAGEFTNSYILARMKVSTQGRFLWARTIGSTLGGQAVDTLVFIGIATLLGVFPPAIFLSLVLTNYIFKVGIEVLFTPVTLVAIRAMKRYEGIDVYDTHSDFNPFSLRTEPISPPQSASEHI